MCSALFFYLNDKDNKNILFLVSINNGDFNTDQNHGDYHFAHNPAALVHILRHTGVKSEINLEVDVYNNDPIGLCLTQNGNA